MRVIALLFSLFFAAALNAQTLIINEVSNGPNGNKEYVELVVVDTAVVYNCSSSTPPCIDIRGWIFDDNSGYHGPSGVAGGAIRFSQDPTWACVPVGTIILLYNNIDQNPAIPAADFSLSDGNCRIVAPVNNTTLFETNLTTPGAVACSYPAVGWTAGGNWNTTLFANTGDCARIVNLSGCEVFSLCWGTDNLNNLIYYTGSGQDDVWYFNGNDPYNQLNWSEGCADGETALDAFTCGADMQTPGLPNNALNAAYIAQFNNNCTPIEPLVASALTTQNEVCGCDGQASASAAGSIAGYTYQWLNASNAPIGQTTATATGLCDGTYKVVITSSIGCTDTAIVTVAPITPLTFLNAVSNENCGNGDGSISLQGQGGNGAPYTYSINGGNSFSSNGIFSNLSAGTYNVAVKDVNGCQVTGTLTLTTTNGPLASISYNDATCFGVCNGTANVNITGGTPPYSIVWQNLGVIFGGNGTNQTTLCAGSYVATVNDDNNNCQVIFNFIINEPADFPVAASNTSPICDGAPLQVNETGGAATSWTWTSNGAAVFSSTTAQNPTITGAVDGEIFSVTASNASGCTHTVQTTVTIYPISSLSLVSTDPVSCTGTDGIIAVNGTGTGTLSWTGTASGSANVTLPYTLNNVSGGTYSFSLISNPGGCVSNTATTTLIVPPTPVLNDIPDESVCDTYILPVISGSNLGTNASFWTGSNASGTQLSAGQSISSTQTIYIHTLANNCTDEESFSITVTPTPSAPAVGPDLTYCSTWEIAPLTAIGTSGVFSWFSDVDLVNLIGTGNAIAPFSAIGTSTYYVNEQINGCISPVSSYSITLEICNIILPTAFTPDGDNTNDLWVIVDLDVVYPKSTVSVYSRWGDKLYESKTGDYANSAWDGTFEGKAMPVGSYYFIIDTGTDAEDLKGIVSIVLE
jgi:gliding motility-associated-like protein